MADDNKLLFYLMRHGYTAMSPRPELWLPIGLDARGRQVVDEASRYFAHYVAQHPSLKPDMIISSDLKRAKETAQIAAKIIGIQDVQYDPQLRAFGGSHETVREYEQRLDAAFKHVLAQAPSIPLVVAHRSTSAWLDKMYGQHDSGWNPDYVHYKLLHEGGILAVTTHRLVPIYRCLTDHFPKQPKASEPKL